MIKKGHMPQDQIYGPLSIPSYCWPIIDTDEFQRLRYILQLGCVVYVYPSTNHSRFEHALGCAHLAGLFLSHFEKTQPEIKIEPKHKKAVIISALCQDLGHGPYSFTFDRVASELYPSWDHTEMSCNILRYIVKKHNINIEDEVIEAACSFMQGMPYEDYPPFLGSIVNNQTCDMDVNKFDYLSRDMNRAINTGRFEYDRLIYNCKIINNELCWKISEIPTIERFFFNFNNMSERVYKHKVVQAIEVMMQDVLEKVFEKVDIEELLEDPAVFVKYDERMMIEVENGIYGQEAKELTNRIIRRDLYKCIGDVRVDPKNEDGKVYSQKMPNAIEQDLLEYLKCEYKESPLRVVSTRFRYGLHENTHPLLAVPFFKDDKIISLQPEQLSSISPVHFAQNVLRVYLTDNNIRGEAEEAFQKWKKMRI